MIFKRKFSFTTKRVPISIINNNYAFGKSCHRHCIFIHNMVIAFTLDKQNELPDEMEKLRGDDSYYYATKYDGSIIDAKNNIGKTILVNAENIIPKIIKWMEFRSDFFKESNIDEMKKLYDKL